MATDESASVPGALIPAINASPECYHAINSHQHSERTMAQLIVRNLDESVKAALQQRAKRSGRSMEAVVREILSDAVASERGHASGLGSRIVRRFRNVGLDEPIEEQRGGKVRPADLEL